MVVSICCLVVSVSSLLLTLSFGATVAVVSYSRVLAVGFHERWFDSMSVVLQGHDCRVTHYSLDHSQQWLLPYSFLSVVCFLYSFGHTVVEVILRP